MKPADVVERAMEHVGTFIIPGVNERHNAGPGDFCKLVFDDASERIWYVVTKRDPDGPSYSGKLANEPLDERIPEVITFGPEHIAGYIVGPGA